MSDTPLKKALHQNHPELYEFRIRGILDPGWSEWLGCLKMNHTKNDETIFVCLVVDQTALHGLLAKLRDLNLGIISMNRVGPEQTVDDDNNDQDH